MALKTCIGLDLGSNAIKLAHLKVGRGDRPEFLAWGIEPLPPESIVDGAIMNQGAVAETVRALVGRLGVRERRVALAVAGNAVIIKKILLPAMTDEELEEQIPWEAEQHIPFDKNDVDLDYQVLSGKNAQGQMELLLVAAKKDVVRDYTSVAREARLDPVVVDVATFAMQNAFEQAYGPLVPEENYVLINIGASVSNINILSAGTTAFTRDVMTGGNLFTDEIKRQLNVPFDEAEELKRAAAEGSELPGPEKRSTGKLTGAPREAERILHQTADQIAGEFSKSIDFFLASHPDVAIGKVYLAGGSARVRSLQRAIAARAHVEIELIDPFRRLTVVEGSGRGKFDLGFLKAHAAQATISVGLALRSQGDKFE